MEPPRPNFFIVGAPKSGTTALYSYLKRHPEIFMCTPKEPQFFASDTFGNQRNITTLSEYLNCFRQAHSPRIGEASTCYLSSPIAPQQIQEFSPQARIIIMLRNPIDVMYAEHSERLVGGGEHISDFARAVDSDEPRRYRTGRFKGQTVVRPSYRELAQFSQQVKRFYDRFNRSNVYVVLYDDFTSDTKRVYNAVLAFLGVSPQQDSSFEIVNANRRIRNVRIHDLVRYPPEPMKAMLRACLPRFLRQKAATWITRLNEQIKPRPMLDTQLMRRLAFDYAEDVKQLGRLVGRDLSYWTAQHSCLSTDTAGNTPEK